MTQTTPRSTPTPDVAPAADQADAAQAADAAAALAAAERRAHLRGAWQPRPTLAGTDYTSEAVFAEERERIWFDRWICLGRTEEIPGPGDYLVRELAGESLFVTRNRAGDLRAFYNICAHRGTKLLDETGDVCGHANKAFKCPYHAWAFDLDGQLIGTPNVDEDETFERADFPLHAIAVDAYGGFLFVHLGESPRPLLDELREGTESITNFERYHLETLRIGRRIVYEVEANWKIVVENYNECLHCPTVHPELVQIVPLYRFGEVWDEETRDDGNWMIEGATSFTRSGRSTLPPFPDLSPDDRRMYYGTFQFPNVLLNLHPDAAMVYTLYPRGPGHTTVVSEYLFAPETIAAPDFSPDPVVELWDLISKQDWVICSRAQTGVSSRAYHSGVYPRKDRFLYDFNERYREEMGRPRLG